MLPALSKLRPGILALALFVAAGVASAQTIITFETLPNLPPLVTSSSGFTTFSAANSGSLVHQGITFDSRFRVVGDNYIEQFQNNGGTARFSTPHSGHYTMFNDSGANGLVITTHLTLSGAWFSRPNFGAGVGGTTQVTIVGLNGSTALASVSLNLTASGSTPTFLDTNAFAPFAGQLTGYRIDRLQTNVGPFSGTHFLVDDLTFTTVPEPSVNALMAIGLLGVVIWLKLRQRDTL